MTVTASQALPTAIMHQCIFTCSYRHHDPNDSNPLIPLQKDSADLDDLGDQSSEEDSNSGLEGSGLRVEELSQTARQVSRQVDT